jgi:hypothetical protein
MSESHEDEHPFRYSTHLELLHSPKARLKVSELKEIISRHVEGFNPADSLVLEEREGRPDSPLGDADDVHIHDTPHFYSHPRGYEIIVNGTEHTAATAVVTFREIVDIAFPELPKNDPNIVFSMTFEKAKSEPHQGTLGEGGAVTVRNGTIFDVAHTNRS